jgi:outer membrane protein TolC
MKLPIITTLCSAFLVFALQMSALAQDKQPVTTTLSLKQAQEYAVKNNVNSRNSVLDMEIAKKRIWETTAMGLPQINGQVNYTHLFTVPEMSLGGSTFLATDLPAGTPITSDDINNQNVYMGYTPGAPIQLGVPNNTTFDITVSQLIFSGEYIVGLQATKVYYLMTEQGKQKTEIDLKELVANIYAAALLTENNLNVMQQSLESSNKTLSDMQKMYSQGLVENTEVDQIEFVASTLKNAVSSLTRELDYTLLNLKFVLGMPFVDKIILTDKLESIAESINLEALVATPFNINNNLDYQILITSEKISNLNVKLAKSAFLPSISAVYRHQEKMNSPAFDFNPKDVFQVSANIPIFSSGMRNVRVQQRKMDLQKTINTKDNVANGLQLQYINSLNELTAAYEKYQNDKRNIELTKRIYDKTLIKFSEGIATSRQITDDLNQYLTAQRSLYTSIFGLFSAKNKLDKLNNNL